MSQSKIKLDLTLLPPELNGDCPECSERYLQLLRNLKGVDQAHITNGEAPPQLCLHYDPNLMTLGRLRRLALDTGTDFSSRYQHEQIPISGLKAADVATTLSINLNALPGMLHATVNYAAGLAFVAYDREKLQRPAIEQFIRHQGGRTLPSPQAKVEEEAHLNIPDFLPTWLQERWEIVLVVLAGIFFLLGWLGEIWWGLPTWTTITLFVLSYVAGGYDVALHAIPGLLKGKFDTDVLMLAAALGAAILGEWAEGAFLLFLFSLGHTGEHYALDRARNAVSALGELMPNTALRKQNDQLTEVPVEDLKLGEVVVVRAGERIPVDGVIAQGTSSVDQSAITGESVPVRKAPGDGVFAGTINADQSLEVGVTRLAHDNTLARVMQMVTEAQSQQSPTQQFTQRFMSWFVPAILITVLLVIVVPPLLNLMTWQASFYRGMLLLVAASPCALALGTPAAVLAGIAQAARNGVLIKGGVYLEALGRLRVLAFDKTGTLTEGKFTVTDIVPNGEISEAELLRIAASAEQQSTHPLAQAVVAAAKARELPLESVTEATNLSGRGLESQLNGRSLLVGSWQLFAEWDNHPLDPAIKARMEGLEAEGKTTMAVSLDQQFLGVLALADTPRPHAADMLQALRRLGIEKLVLLTGDNATVAQRIGSQLGIDDVRASLLPEEKLAAIQALEQAHGDIAMTGDGVNDAPALATATVGIAMGGAGTAVALETADVALMGDDLSKLPYAVGLSRASRRIIQQNLAIALGVILLLIVTSVLGLIQLSLAVVLHEGSTIVVVLNALRLLAYKNN